MFDVAGTFAFYYRRACYFGHQVILETQMLFTLTGVESSTHSFQTLNLPTLNSLPTLFKRISMMYTYRQYNVKFLGHFSSLPSCK
jgi:hypothetical protein